MERKKPNLADYFDLPNPGLLSYFMRTERGNQDDYRPPFWKDKPREEVFESWQEVFDTLGVKEKWPTLYGFEMDMKGKAGPMSIQLPLQDRLESIESYWQDLPSVPIPQEAIDAVIALFGKAKGIRPRTKENTVQEMRLSTNSGNWKFTKRRRVVLETLEATIEFDLEHHQIYVISRGKRYQLAAVLGWRGQEGGIHDDDVKQRVIWMMAFLLNILELQFYQPAVKAFQRHNLIPAYVSMDAVDKEVTQLFDTKGPDDDVVCTDFTRFDQHFNQDMQDAAEKIERGLAADPNLAWFNEVFPVKFNLPLICSEDIMYTGHHGMGSGSGGTNFDECMAHKALQFEAAQSQGQKLNPHSMAYGDDGILTYPGIKIEDVIRVYTSHGQEMNETKQYISKHDCVVLRRWHSDSYRVDGIMVGVYSTFRALGRLLAQERFYDPEEWGPEQVTLRAWSIIENCNKSPVFEQFVDFVIKGDKYRLGLDIPGFMENINKIVNKSIENLPDFLGYTKTQQKEDAAKGIREWRIYKYLMTKK